MKVTHCLLLSLVMLIPGPASAAGWTIRGDNGPDGADASRGGEDDPPTYTIVLDAGHGGRDLGTRGAAHAEKDLALAIVLALGERLEARPVGDVRVVYTRTEDAFVPLHERAALANAERADLFVSVHCNFLESRDDWHGSETYVMGLHTAEHNLGVAKRENAAVRLEGDAPAAHYDFDPASPMGHIILANFQHAYLERSLAAAAALEESLGERAGRRSRGVKQAGFVVLRETAMPSVLVETGYLSNSEEEAYLASESGVDATAEALYRGLERYLRSLVGDTAAVAAGEPPAPAAAAAPAPRPAPTPATRLTAAHAPPPDHPPVGEAPAAPPFADERVAFYVQLAAAATALDTEGERWRRLGAAVRVLRESRMLKYQAGPYASHAAAAAAARTASGLGFDGAFPVGYRAGARLTPAELAAFR